MATEMNDVAVHVVDSSHDFTVTTRLWM